MYILALEEKLAALKQQAHALGLPVSPAYTYPFILLHVRLSVQLTTFVVLVAVDEGAAVERPVAVVAHFACRDSPSTTAHPSSA